MPDQLRPDLTGVIFSIERQSAPQNPFEQEFVLARSVNSLADLDHPMVRAALQTFVEQGDLPIWLSHNQERRLFHPYPALRDAILSRGLVPAELVESAALWRRRLGLRA